MKKRAVIFMADGFEEIEAITPIDLLRRADVAVEMVSISESLTVVGAHGITVQCDSLFSHFNLHGIDVYILPGGAGHKLLAKNAQLGVVLKQAHNQGVLIAAICAAPSILGDLDILLNKRACCFPGFEGSLNCKEVVMNEPVVVDGNVITSRGAGTAYQFGLAIVAKFFCKDKADKLASQTIFTSN